MPLIGLLYSISCIQRNSLFSARQLLSFFHLFLVSLVHFSLPKELICIFLVIINSYFPINPYTVTIYVIIASTRQSNFPRRFKGLVWYFYLSEGCHSFLPHWSISFLLYLLFCQGETSMHCIYIPFLFMHVLCQSPYRWKFW